MTTISPPPGPSHLDGQFAIVPIVPYGAPPSNAIAHGNLSTVMAHLPDTVARSEALARADALMDKIEAAEAEQALTRAAQVAIFADTVATLSQRLIALEARRDAQAKRDQEEQEQQGRERIAAVLDGLPDVDDPTPYPFNPSGDLHSLGPSEPQNKLELAVTEDGDDGPGDLPNALLETAPADPGDHPIDDPAEELGGSAWPPKHIQPQPVSVSLNTDDD
jgi:hypothetical protein